MKIAVVTDDGQTISRHFGRARAFAVVTVEGEEIVSRELREKSSPHGRPDAAPHDDGADAHTGPAARSKHVDMLAPIRDCAVIVAGGMGRGAYDHARELGIRPVVTSMREIDVAAVECAAGRIADEAERLH